MIANSAGTIHLRSFPTSKKSKGELRRSRNESKGHSLKGAASGWSPPGRRKGRDGRSIAVCSKGSRNWRSMCNPLMMIRDSRSYADSRTIRREVRRIEILFNENRIAARDHVRQWPHSGHRPETLPVRSYPQARHCPRRRRVRVIRRLRFAR